jgi:hypothetical protein
MKKLTILILTASVLTLAAGKQTFSGVITDTMCGGNHRAMNVTPESKCVTECVRMGAKYALWDGKKTYTLTDQKTPAALAAQKVNVVGTLDAAGSTIQVESITAAK